MAKTTRNDILIETDVAGVFEGFTEPDDTTVVVLDPIQLKSLEFIAKHLEPILDYNKKPKKERRNRDIRNSVEIEEKIDVEVKNIQERTNKIQKGEHGQQEIK